VSQIFSQFTMCLDLIELSLHTENVDYARLDGSMTKAQRVSEIARFKADPSVAVFLISLKTGNCGLNLTHVRSFALFIPNNGHRH
jgi:SNF2 family DNA or RNA helicase